MLKMWIRIKIFFHKNMWKNINEVRFPFLEIYGEPLLDFLRQYHIRKGIIHGF